MKNKTNIYLIVALLLGIVFHGTSIFFTLETTYDALIHLFFAEHYSNSWFEPWNYKWYTGFTVMSYPPLVHQAIAALSFIGGLKFGLFTVALIAIVLFITGVYRFSLLLTANRTVAGYAALLAVFSSSFVETLHIFGQLPSIVGVSLLMHALPEIYLWLVNGKFRYLIKALVLIAVTVTSHHVTPIFGMIFFIFPVIGMAIMDVSKAKTKSYKSIKFNDFLNSFLKLFKRIVGFGFLSLIIIITCILPYWINSKNNPITQVPIPHGSRDSFIEVTSSGLVFFLIPWGVLLLLLPYFFYRFYSKRYLFFGLSFTILFVLGTGGTTPIPRLALGETAFNILTLDRFTLWASIMALPLFGEYVYRLIKGDLKTLTKQYFGAAFYRMVCGMLALLFVFMCIFTMSLGYFRPSQPQQIKMKPIVNFLNQDQHYKWRYMTLGFGDQMAWLSAQTQALSVDGNYHSARRLPELTTRPIERLENSKFKGIEGIGSLQQFLTTPEKYNLKYIFSNDKFYDPILYFCGWRRLRQLENGIMVWEKLNVPPLSSILPKDSVATWQKMVWGIVPFLTVFLALLINFKSIIYRSLKIKSLQQPKYLKHTKTYKTFSKSVFKILAVWSLILISIVGVSIYNLYLKNNAHYSPENAVLAYFDALDFKNFEKAHGLINPKHNISISEYMLQVSVTDGLLSSYAKLNSITTKTLSKTKNKAVLNITTNWITPLEKITKHYTKTLVNNNNKWYLEPNIISVDIPPDQLFTQNTTQFYNHGRRRITTEQTHHEDVLKQPELSVISAKLVKYNSHYAIIGELQNIDNLPADVVLKATLYNNTNKALATYNAKYHVKHKLMPKEVTPFRINFEGIAWSKIQDHIPNTFNPDEFTPVNLNELPTKFNLQVASNVSGSDLYNTTSLSLTEITNLKLNGFLFNYGVQEVTIPQLLISYYDKNKTLLWVDHQFIKEGVRQQRKQYFEYSFMGNNNITIVNDNMQNCFVNGLPNPIIKNTELKNNALELQTIPHTKYKYIKLNVNTYVGNPR